MVGPHSGRLRSRGKRDSLLAVGYGSEVLLGLHHLSCTNDPYLNTCRCQMCIPCTAKATEDNG